MNGNVLQVWTYFVIHVIEMMKSLIDHKLRCSIVDRKNGDMKDLWRNTNKCLVKRRRDIELSTTEMWDRKKRITWFAEVLICSPSSVMTNSLFVPSPKTNTNLKYYSKSSISDIHIYGLRGARLLSPLQISELKTTFTNDASALPRPNGRGISYIEARATNYLYSI